jgi:hypothetical protein
MFLNFPNLIYIYRVIKKKTNQECYLIFCFIENFVLDWTHTHNSYYACYEQSFYWLPTSRKIY